MGNFQSFCASDLGSSLRKERKKKRLTQDELAKLACCRRETIIAMEAGDNVSLYTLMAILGALGKGIEVCDVRLELENLTAMFRDDDEG